MSWFIFWVIGSMFTDGLKDPLNVGGFKEGFNRFFDWPWEIGQFVRIYIDGGNSRGQAYDEKRCAEAVGQWIFVQCSQKNGHGKDGLYCKQHGKKYEQN
jgi:hypothetical protein